MSNKLYTKKAWLIELMQKRFEYADQKAKLIAKGIAIDEAIEETKHEIALLEMAEEDARIAEEINRGYKSISKNDWIDRQHEDRNIH